MVTTGGLSHWTAAEVAAYRAGLTAAIDLLEAHAAAATKAASEALVRQALTRTPSAGGDVTRWTAQRDGARAVAAALRVLRADPTPHPRTPGAPR